VSLPRAIPASPYGSVPVTLLADVSRSLARFDRRRVALELELVAAVLADPTRAYLAARAVGITWRHFKEPDCLCLWFACERSRFKPLADVLSYAARCLRLAGLWDDVPDGSGRVYRGAWKGLRWHWGALAGTALACRPDSTRVRRLAAELLELDHRQREAEQGLAYACRVLAGGNQKGAVDGSNNGAIKEHGDAGRPEAATTQAGFQRPPRRVVA
jgi:hypothetical protein